MKKLRKFMVAVLSMCMLFGFSVTCYAGTLTATCEKDWIHAYYKADEYGNVLKLVMEFTEKHPATGHVYSSSQSRTSGGAYDYISDSRNADAGYQYTFLNAYVYENGIYVHQGYDTP